MLRFSALSLHATLAVGTAAPDWHLPGHDGRHYQHARGTWTILVFYPRDRTPGCRRQLHAFDAARPELEARNVRVFGVNFADVDSHRDFASCESYRFPLLADAGGHVARHFRACIPVPGRPIILRTVYLVGPDECIAFAQRGDPAPALVLAAVRA